MAITRCPYCHAIIDENDKYCNNCGTQLLFPDDEEADEEIPGEKIVDAEVEEKDYTVDEPEDEKRLRPAAADDEDLDERLEEEMKDRAAETALDEIVAEGGLDEGAEDVTEEVILVDEIEEVAAADTAGAGELEARTGTGLMGVEDEELEEEDEKDEKGVQPEQEAGDDEEDKGKDKDKDEEEDEDEIGKTEEAEAEEKEESPEALPRTGTGEKSAPGDEPVEDAPPREAPPAAEEEPVIEYITETGAEDEPGAAERIPSPRPATFDTRELEGIGRTVDLGKNKVDELLAELAMKEAPTPEPASPAAETPREPTGSLPPWASGMRGAPVFPPDTTPLDARSVPRERGATPEEEEVEIFPKRRPSDSSIGLPERVSQAPLPFAAEESEESDGAAEEAEEAETEADEETAETAVPPPSPARPERPAFPPGREPEAGRIEVLEEYEEPEARGPFSFAVFLKSKAFDLLFVGLFWLVALWLAAHATDRTLFEVLGAVSGPMLLLYAVFVLIYFFLFKFFLGETLGDRLFRPRD